MIKISLFSKKVINPHPYNVCPGDTCAVLSRGNKGTQKFSPYEEVKVKSLSPVRPTRLLCPWDFQARILEWVAIPSAKGSSPPRDGTQVSCTTGRPSTI